MRFHLFHNWTKWEKYKSGTTANNGVFSGHYITQVRECTVCGKIELRSTEA